jgi:hypothetical protein
MKKLAKSASEIKALVAAELQKTVACADVDPALLVVVRERSNWMVTLRRDGSRIDETCFATVHDVGKRLAAEFDLAGSGEDVDVAISTLSSGEDSEHRRGDDLTGRRVIEHGAPREDRTANLRVRSATLYPPSTGRDLASLLGGIDDCRLADSVAV